MYASQKSVTEEEQNTVSLVVIHGFYVLSFHLCALCVPLCGLCVTPNSHFKHPEKRTGSDNYQIIIT